MTLDAQPPEVTLRKDLQIRLAGLRRLEERLLRGWGPAGLGPQPARAFDAAMDVDTWEEEGPRGAAGAVEAVTGAAPQISLAHASAFFLAAMSTTVIRRDLEHKGEGDAVETAGVAYGSDVPFLGIEALVGGRYRLREPVASGGMGRVYRALDEKLGRSVVVKILARAAAPFLQEALEATATLDHPGILRATETGTFQEVRYVVLPLVEGTSLEVLLRAQAAASAREGARGALLLAHRRMSAAMAYAHLRGVVHRDLKPTNVLVTPEGRVVVIDWGIACRVGSTRGEGEGAGGPIAGTPYYMAPEQFRGEEVTPSTDVFALGTILYTILTGVHPAGEGGSIAEIADRILHDVPLPPSALVEDVPEALDDAAVRALQKDPRKRFRDATELLDALEEAPTRR